ncbi:F-box/LRR protein, partial [Trifolium pratense]
SDLFLIADCFPLLEELDLSNPRKGVSRRSLRHGLETLSLALFKLRKVNLSGHNYINNQNLLHLFKNCKLLEAVIIFDCFGLTSAGISSSLRERPTLRSLSLSDSYEQLDYDERLNSHFIDSLVSLKGLTCIDLTRLQISDELLYSIARNTFQIIDVMFACILNVAC